MYYRCLSISLLLAIAGCSLGDAQGRQHEAATTQKPEPTVIDTPETSAKPSGLFRQCSSPRPEMCIEIYQPVCAQRDTGVRCVTTPCPSSEWVTKANSCIACSDVKVAGFKPDACSH